MQVGRAGGFMKSPFAGVGRRTLATLINGIPLTVIFFVVVMQFG